MIGRICRSSDFTRVMSSPGFSAKSKHFALQYLDGQPSIALKKSQTLRACEELSTEQQQGRLGVVDHLNKSSLNSAANNVWLGLVVPKRYAKRSVTRSLMKRQMRSAVVQQQSQAPLKKGLWVLRLRAAFDASRFKSAASPELKHAVNEELRELLSSTAVRCRSISLAGC